MAMQYNKEQLIRLGDEDLAKIVDGAHEAFKKRHPGMKDIAFPQPLEQIRFTLEITAVREELYMRTREAVEATGHNFVAAIRPLSIEDLLAEDSQRKPGRFSFVNNSKTMRATVPPEMEVAINPDRFRIEGSNSLSTNEQKNKIKEEEARWKNQLPKDIRPLVGMYMVDPSTLSQLEDAYMDKTGKLLLSDYFARTDVQTVSGYVALVGRHDPTNQRFVSDWLRDLGDHDVFAVSVVVLPRKLAA